MQEFPAAYPRRAQTGERKRGPDQVVQGYPAGEFGTLDNALRRCKLIFSKIAEKIPAIRASLHSSSFGRSAWGVFRFWSRMARLI